MLRILTILFFVTIISFPGVAFSQSKPDAASHQAMCQQVFQEVARQIDVAVSIYKKVLLAQNIITTSADEIAFRKQIALEKMGMIVILLPEDIEQCAK